MQRFELEQRDEQNEEENISKGPKIGKRHVQVLNIFFLIFAAYYTRNCLSIAIVAMNDRNASSNVYIPTFNWKNKNIILSSFFFGYVPFQVILAWAFYRTRLKPLVITLVVIGSFLGLLTPTVAVHFEEKGMIAVRILQGIAQSFTFPLAHYLLAQWVPPKERSVLGGVAFLGIPWATVVANLIPGFIAASSLGWPWIFYSANILSLLWCISFGVLSYDKPATHPAISEKEKIYIRKSLLHQNSEKSATPIRAIFSSLPVWAITVAHTGQLWSTWTMQTQIPMYLNYVLKFQIATTGSLASLPYFLQWIFGLIFGFISDTLINKNIWSISTSRKVMTAIGSFVPAIALILLQHAGPSDVTKAIIFLNVALGFKGAVYSGYLISPLDLSQRHAGFVVGFCNSLAQITGFLAPLFAQAVITHEDNEDEWKLIFYTAAGFLTIGGLFFILFGSAKTQLWNSNDSTGIPEVNVNLTNS